MYDDFGGSDICMVFLFVGKERVGFPRKVGKGCPLILILILIFSYILLYMISGSLDLLRQHVVMHLDNFNYMFIMSTKCWELIELGFNIVDVACDDSHVTLVDVACKHLVCKGI